MKPNAPFAQSDCTNWPLIVKLGTLVVFTIALALWLVPNSIVPISLQPSRPQAATAMRKLNNGPTPVDATVTPTSMTLTSLTESNHSPTAVPLGDMQLGQPSGLPLPGAMSVAKFESHLFPFLKSRKYVDLGWKTDKGVRDTGPFIDGKYYGTHPAVRVFYSPEMIRWLASGRVGTIPDGAMMIKEQYPPPAARHAGKTEQQLRESLESWTIMVKDASVSHDGWFWSNPGADPKVVDNHEYPFDHPISGAGHYCVRCHGSTQSPNATSPEINNEFTFSALRNIEGFPGEPIIFRVDDSWRAEVKSAGEPEESKPEETPPEEPHETDDSDDTDDSDPSGQPVEEADDGTLAKKLREKFHSFNIDSGPSKGSHPSCTNLDHPEKCNSRPDDAFLEYFSAIADQSRDAILNIPPITHDWVVQNADRSRDFITSNQCMSCHAGLMKPYGPSMFVPAGESSDYAEPGWHISPYGEWRWTPMGLAGRDPVFYAQMESEIARLNQEFKPEKSELIADALVNTCMRCHGAMGKHQFDKDHAHDPVASNEEAGKHVSRVQQVSSVRASDTEIAKSANEKITLEHIYKTLTEGAPQDQTDAHYGALARDGVSCMVCHKMQPLEQPADDDRPYLKFYLETSITGNLHFGQKDEIYGPYKDDDIKPYVMHHATGIKPVHSDYLKSSQMCGSCHTVSLPAVDNPLHETSQPLGDALVDSDALADGAVDRHNHHEHSADDQELIDGESEPLFKDFHHHIEQATYLEWLNSKFENEFNTTNPEAQTCQDCHMSKGLSDPESGIDIESISTRIAAIQDATYPDAENLTPLDNLDIKVRDDYSRHNFSGLNVFLVEMFKQHDDILGVRKFDFMTGSKLDIENAIKNFVQTARMKTADVSVKSRIIDAKNSDTEKVPGRKLVADVTVVNKAGHRFPSGVGFRRAFLEVTVTQKSDDGSAEVIWASGSTNKLGVIVGANGKPLPEESFARDESGRQSWHRHHEVITSQDQAQVYETLLLDDSGEFTTSFIHGCVRQKDNRFLPQGWTKAGPEPEALSGRYLEATHPGPTAIHDPQYTDGSGSDQVRYEIAIPADVNPEDLTVEAKLYYQAIPPYFLANLFNSQPAGPAIKRLHFLCSNLKLDDTVIKDWKLLIQNATSKVGPGE